MAKAVWKAPPVRKAPKTPSRTAKQPIPTPPRPRKAPNRDQTVPTPVAEAETVVTAREPPPSKQDRAIQADISMQDALLAVGQERDRLDRMMELFLNPDHIEHFTEMSRREVLAFSAMETIAEKHNLDFLASFLHHNKAQRVSLGRKGRGEWVKILKQELMADPINGIQGDTSRRGRFLGRRR